MSELSWSSSSSRRRSTADSVTIRALLRGGWSGITVATEEPDSLRARLSEAEERGGLDRMVTRSVSDFEQTERRSADVQQLF